MWTKIELSIRKIKEQARRDEDGIRDVATNIGELIREEMRNAGQRQE